MINKPVLPTLARLAGLASLMLASVPAHALDFECSDYRPFMQNRQIERPEPPSCASFGVQFYGESDFDMCRSEMEAYQRKLKGYGSCLASEQNEAVKEFNEAVDSFNRKARN